MKKWILLLLCLLFVLPCTVFADKPLIVDEADILTSEQELILEEKARQLVDTYQMDVVILTIDTLNGEYSDWYAQEYYEENLYGIGSDYDGILFLLSMQEREWAMITCGDAKFVLTDYGIESIFSDIAWYLSEDQYFNGFSQWLTELVRYFEAYEDGEPIDGFIWDYEGPGSYEPIQGEGTVHYEGEPMGPFGKFMIALVIGLAVGGITILIMRSGMKTAKPQHAATNYLVQGSYNLSVRNDMFLYSNVSKVRKPESNSGGGRGGGSTFRMGGGGRSFGGGRGKF